MAPPPVASTTPPPRQTAPPSRFLLPKRQPSTSQAWTPQAGTPSHPATGSQQFNATPRFSLSSTPRPSPTLPGTLASTPSALAKARPPRTQDAILASSPERSDSLCGSPSPPRRPVVPRSSPDSIEPASPAPDTAGDDGPTPKRRRISISTDPGPTSSPPEGSIGVTDVDDASAHNSDYVYDIDVDIDIEGADTHADDDHRHHLASQSSQDSPGGPQPLQLQASRPVFRPVPRFKAAGPEQGGPAAAAAAATYPLPDAFSPRRRGEKYVAGGLAAELRDWLVGVKGAAAAGGDGANGPAAAAVVEVEEARPGPGMWLVLGRRLGRDREGAGGDGAEVRAVLAGEGRLAGLARRNRVVRGCAVQFLPPTWDLELLGGKWSVVCEWSVLEEGDGQSGDGRPGDGRPAG